jgi:hypothetical protein
MDINIENGTPLGEVRELLAGLGFTLDGELSISGKPATDEDVPEQDDVVASAKTPSGN